ncbi:hypothetical protein RFI_12760 [Reticulomyxa filosa]|uniref:Uncharacterized protein n=1 Tax=Reticulomyxa filosa TaxID=46433 RepID=X6NDM0_RETFI|nr:hypothetical protein RFI_12760 [Reticulomyxa filosa]|eukprot:ETO24395.1 hypothetical protein RFI_12760 [Reticulomyxa filosa]
MIMKKFEELEKLEKAKHEVECRIFLIQQEKRPSGLNKIEASDEEMEKEKENTKEHAKEQEQGQGQEREQDREKEKEAKTSVLTEEDMAKLFRQTSSYTVQSVLNNNTLFYPKPRDVNVKKKKKRLYKYTHCVDINKNLKKKKKKKKARSEESEDDTNTDEDVIQHFQRAAGFNMSENDSELSLLNIFAGDNISETEFFNSTAAQAKGKATAAKNPFGQSKAAQRTKLATKRSSQKKKGDTARSRAPSCIIKYDEKSGLASTKVGQRDIISKRRFNFYLLFLFCSFTMK